MERRLEIGGTLSAAFAIYREQAGVLLPLAFTFYLLVAVIEGLAADSLLALPLGMAASTIAATIYQGMVVGLVSDVQDGRRDSSVNELGRATAPVILPLIGAGILAGLGVGVGFLLLIVPGLILMTIWAVIAPVIVVERSGVFAAFGRSHDLVSGQGWRVFAVVIVANLIALIAVFVCGVIAISISDSTLVFILSSVLALTLAAPIGALVAAVMYFRLRELEGPAALEPEPDPVVPDAPVV